MGMRTTRVRRTYLEDRLVVGSVRTSCGGDENNRERYASHRDNTKDQLELRQRKRLGERASREVLEKSKVRVGRALNAARLATPRILSHAQSRRPRLRYVLILMTTTLG